MRRRSRSLLILLASGVALAGLGCEHPRGKPGPEPEVLRPDQVLDFATLYKQNCVACHGTDQVPGAAVSLANPVFLAVAGEENLKSVIADGVPGKLMPPFARSAGGMLTDEQVEILAKGLVTTWGKPGILDGQNPPPYKAMLHPEPAAGQQPFSNYCGRCHGMNGGGGENPPVGSIVDPAYLGLISDQELRNIVIAGAQGMPDWRADSPGHPMSDEDVTAIVAWLGSHRLSSAATTAMASPVPAAKPQTAAKAAHEHGSPQEPQP
jgi:mono/diheme cytochrome c family protein